MRVKWERGTRVAKLSPKQLENLRRGREALAQKRQEQEQAGQEQAEPGGQATPPVSGLAPASEPASAAGLASATSTSFSAGSSANGSGAQASEDQPLDAGALELLFDVPDDATPSPGKTVRSSKKRGVLRPAKPAATSASGKPRPAGRVPTAQEAASARELQIAAEAERLTPTVADILIAAAGYVVGQELAPDEDMAAKMAGPLLRIGMRHLPVLMDVSPDAQDAGQLAAALIIYSQTVGPAIRAKRLERKVVNGSQGPQRSRGRLVNFARPVQAGAPAGRAEYHASAAGPGAAGANAGYDNTHAPGHAVRAPAAADIDAVYQELGITLPG